MSEPSHLTPTRADRLRTILTEQFTPTRIEIRDDSARHAGHAGAQQGGQTHFNVLLVAAAFTGLPRVHRARLVHDVLTREFAEGMHALSLVLKAPGET